MIILDILSFFLSKRMRLNCPYNATLRFCFFRDLNTLKIFLDFQMARMGNEKEFVNLVFFL